MASRQLALARSLLVTEQFKRFYLSIAAHLWSDQTLTKPGRSGLVLGGHFRRKK